MFIDDDTRHFSVGQFARRFDVEKKKVRHMIKRGILRAVKKETLSGKDAWAIPEEAVNEWDKPKKDNLTSISIFREDIGKLENENDKLR